MHLFCNSFEEGVVGFKTIFLCFCNRFVKVFRLFTCDSRTFGDLMTASDLLVELSGLFIFDVLFRLSLTLRLRALLVVYKFKD